MAHENGIKQRSAKRRYVQGMLDETDPLNKGPQRIRFQFLALYTVASVEEDR